MPLLELQSGPSSTCMYHFLMSSYFLPIVTSISSTAEQPDDSMARLVLLAEVLASQSLPTSVELVSCLLETINAVLHADSANTDVAYLQQLLMAAIENVTTKMVGSC
jgi:hypothetical protein